MSKKKPTPIEPYHAISEKVKSHIRYNDTLDESPAYNDMSYVAQILYLKMWKSAGNKKVFQYPYSIYIKYFTKPTFIKAKKELIRHGFIKVVENNANLRKANVYEFIEDWKYKK